MNSMIIDTSNSNSFPYPAVLTEGEPFAFDPGSPEGRSWSSISDSSSGFVSEFPELSSNTENTCLNLDTMMPGLESVLSSRNESCEHPQSRFAKPASRGVADSPRSRYRSSPYPTALGRSRSLSTGSVAFSGSQCSSNFTHSGSPSVGFESHHTFHPSGANSMPVIPDLEFNVFCQPQASNFPGAHFSPDGLFIPPSADESNCSSIQTSPEIVNVLHSSNPARSECEHHFAGSSKPPDLFGPLQEDQLSPPPEDLDGEDSETPRAQELRFDGDLYTPKYVRGHGNKREGWCGICKPGRWLVLKNSAFWYDKSFTHGISAATGSAFEGPKQTRRMKGNPDVWEGLCHSCGDWIALISNKKKGTTWFRHAYKVYLTPFIGTGARFNRRDSVTPIKKSRIRRKGDERSHTQKARKRPSRDEHHARRAMVHPIPWTRFWYLWMKRLSHNKMAFQLFVRFRPSFKLPFFQAWVF